MKGAVTTLLLLILTIAAIGLVYAEPWTAAKQIKTDAATELGSISKPN